MPDFSKRSDQKELLDRDDIPFQDISRNMAELEFINRWLGGHAITLCGFRELLKKQTHPSDRPLLIGEIGCGGGDNLRAIADWCDRKEIPYRLIGIDKNPECIEHARKRHPELPAQWIVADYRKAPLTDQADILFSSLFCHHFSNEQLKEQLIWMQQHSTKGFFINDLHRHPLAYYSIRLLTQLFSKSYLVKNDAPLSVCRGFSRSDWEKILEETGLSRTSVQWKWAFRWLLCHASR